MKTLSVLLATLLLTCGFASAQDVTGFVAPKTPTPSVAPQSPNNPPNPHPDLKPKLGGVFVDGAIYGAIMISPTAPASYGIGEKYLAAPLPDAEDPQHETGPAAHRDTGGIKLFTFEF